jgi:capsular exopolysaccharide synthesis family protein
MDMTRRARRDPPRSLMSDSRPIQRYMNNLPAAGHQPAGAIMTPQGPAVIQIIDMPTSLGPVTGGGNGAARRPGGINVVGAVIRRWWLVLAVFLVIGGGAFLAGSSMVKPQFEARAKVSFVDDTYSLPQNGFGMANQVIHRATLLMNSRDIPLRAAQDQKLRAVLPKDFAINLADPAEEAAFLKGNKDRVTVEEPQIGGQGVIDVIALESSKEAAEAVANAYANAMVGYCADSVKEVQDKKLNGLIEDLRKGDEELAAMLKRQAKLKADNNFDVNDVRRNESLKAIAGLEAKAIEARVVAAAAKARYDELMKNNRESNANKIQRLDIVEQEKARDQILKGHMDNLSTWYGKLSEQKAVGMTDEHPLVKTARENITRAQHAIADREAEITQIVNERLDYRIKLESGKTVDEAKQKWDEAQAQLAHYNQEMEKLGEEAKKLIAIKVEIDELERRAREIAGRNDANAIAIANAKLQMASAPAATFKVEQPAVAMLKEDKRIKVQAGGLVGGLFLGILMALLVDKFDKRLRDPRDIEPLFGAALLGTIPRIQELKRIKGEQARNLIAEEFRIIRTQVLFGNPDLSHKLIAITSPSPGDGKTSLAVNLAISIAKAGRRVLLVDGDLRKPDVHRVFNIPDSPGFAELIQGSHEPGAVIKKSEIDGLEILPAGTPINRPSELLSRPEMARLLSALGELYDHIVIDTAPLLPVSDTHVLAGMVDGVIVSFNAEVDRDTVSVTQDILRRSRANVIGSVMNQVKYRQSGSYQRGKSAYDSYYNSPRGATVKSDKLATVGKA